MSQSFSQHVMDPQSLNRWAARAYAHAGQSRAAAHVVGYTAAGDACWMAQRSRNAARAVTKPIFGAAPGEPREPNGRVAHPLLARSAALGVVFAAAAGAMLGAGYEVGKAALAPLRQPGASLNAIPGAAAVGAKRGAGLVTQAAQRAPLAQWLGVALAALSQYGALCAGAAAGLAIGTVRGLGRALAGGVHSRATVPAALPI